MARQVSTYMSCLRNQNLPINRALKKRCRNGKMYIAPIPVRNNVAITRLLTCPSKFNDISNKNHFQAYTKLVKARYPNRQSIHILSKQVVLKMMYKTHQYIGESFSCGDAIMSFQNYATQSQAKRAQSLLSRDANLFKWYTIKTIHIIEVQIILFIRKFQIIC